MTELSQYELRTASSDTDLRAYHAIRRSVLFDARGRTGYDENYPDETNPTNRRLLLLFRGSPVCAFRLDRTTRDIGTIRLMAVAQHEQRKGHGRAALALLTELTRQLAFKAVEVGSASDAVGFYLRSGFKMVDPLREAPLLRLELT